MSILGHGSFGVVFGPFDNTTVNQMSLFNKRVTNDHSLYVIKLHTTVIERQSQQKQQLYHKLERMSRHHSIIFPLMTSFHTGAQIGRKFPFMKESIDPNKIYQIELQYYGGISMEKMVRTKKSFTMKNFLQLWKSMANILEDCFHILFDHNLIMTDIKMENMVLSDDYVLRLIDVDINPNSKTRRTITPSIIDLPVQYFSYQWWHPLHADIRKKVGQYYRNYYKDLKEKHDPIVPILAFIHNYNDPSFFVEHQTTRQDNQFQRLFFVMYPLFLIVIVLVIRKCIIIETKADMIHLKKIVKFCLSMLQKRGHFSKTFNYKDFQHFLWIMKTV